MVQTSSYLKATTKDPEQDGKLIPGLSARRPDDVDAETVLIHLQNVLEERQVGDSVQDLAEQVIPAC